MLRKIAEKNWRKKMIKRIFAYPKNETHPIHRTKERQRPFFGIPSRVCWRSRD